MYIFTIIVCIHTTNKIPIYSSIYGMIKIQIILKFSAHECKINLTLKIDHIYQRFWNQMEKGQIINYGY